ncbi:ABC transporter permease [Camelimonas fluminis]|uniref:ABC transporter ATP-binding protein/permease n=1 Tax=Camelimonas fluminis TaxID=1576911 RepID=A0ABV7UFM1_9HYPH|nr:SbmA/BacA-like family transporter [Camelimonas fluminis]GHE62315.1 ABC transporter permease [Camelimonas fluminis]
MKALASCIWGLFRLCMSGPGGKAGLVCFGGVLALNLAGVYVNVRLIAWYAAFYNALQKMDASAALTQIGVFLILIALASALALLAIWVRKIGIMHWRGALTSAMLDAWLNSRAHWRLAHGGQPDNHIDNPDQRIAEDCEIFVRRLLSEALDVITMVVGLFTYFSVLWSLSTFSLPLGFIGLDVEIPRYMVWAAPIYVLLSSLVTHVLGARLMKLNMEQQHREADFRYALSRLREASSAVSLQAGEPAERRILDQRFSRIVDNWRYLIRREFIVGCFIRPYMMSTMRLPLFLAAPAYFAGNVALGGLMQLNVAFQQVTQTMSWFIFSYHDLAEFVSAARRLNGFRVRVGEAAGASSGIALTHGDVDQLETRGLSLTSPHGGVIARIPDFTISRGETVWLRGASGRGKSTLFKALAGMWRYGEGKVVCPSGRAMFLPQHPYLPLGDLHQAAVYPASLLAEGELPKPGERAFTVAQAEALLQAVGLGGRAATWAPAAAETGCARGHCIAHAGPQGLSGGEQQRLMLARVLAAAADWVFLDEATSALDQQAERELFQLLRQRLPGATLVIVTHRPPPLPGPVRTIDLTWPEPEEAGQVAVFRVATA